MYRIGRAFPYSTPDAIDRGARVVVTNGLGLAGHLAAIDAFDLLSVSLTIGVSEILVWLVVIWSVSFFNMEIVAR